MDRTSLPDHFFTGLDRGQPAEELAELIASACQAFRELHDVVQLLGGTLPLPPDDRGLLRQWAKDAPAEVRAAAVEALCAIEPVTWNELEAWAMDEDGDVRRAVLLSMETPDTSACAQRWTNENRFIRLLLAMAERRADYPAGMALADLSQDDELLERIWPEMVRLLDKNEPALNAMLLSTYFEHIITEHRWGPNSTLLQSWFTEEHEARQRMLLIAACWMGLQAGRLGEIAQALARSPNPRIAALAQGVLEGTVNCQALMEG
ncbi:MAG: hypothetical protein ACYDCO_03195 [Armatimonadota bacterium]